MNDPFGSMNGFLSQFRGFMQNPAGFLAQRMIPQNAMQDPRGAVQALMNSGQMSQQQFNALQQAARRIAANPLFSQMIGQ